MSDQENQALRHGGASPLLIMRHGEAAPGFPDPVRALTRRGEQEAGAMARWLAARVSEGELATPCCMPARMCVRSKPLSISVMSLGIPLNTLPFITPDDSASDVAEWLMAQQPQGPIMLVSHMPLVGELAGLLIEGSPSQGLGFPTAAIAELEADVWAAGCAQLQRFTQPSQL
ncbi:SixA phosphatase family protein [Halomonas sp. BC2]|uniref:SixA phosphatase family protein n=1 Tax=Halomonas sp. BC2 TaxID=1670449 RepID=UPI0020160F21|nr:phosphohistidine phosphatase SixA [Halomonas sp. BC2]